MISHRSEVAIKSVTDIHKNQRDYAHSLEKLITGKSINRAADNGAALKLANMQGADSASISMAVRNVNDGMLFVQSGEASLEQISLLLDKMKTYALQSASDTYNDGDRTDILSPQFQDLGAELDRTAKSANFRDVFTLNNSENSFAIQIGHLGNEDHRLVSDMTQINSTLLALGLDSVVSNGISSKADARAALDAIDIAQDSLTVKRNFIGSQHERLQSALSDLQEFQLTNDASVAKIEDADYAIESSRTHSIEMKTATSVNTLRKYGEIQMQTIANLLLS
jgi:flagellin